MDIYEILGLSLMGLNNVLLLISLKKPKKG